MKIPTWVTLRNISDEFRGVAHQIAAGIGEVLGSDIGTNSSDDPRFCLGLESGRGWQTSVVITNSATQLNSGVLIDYNFLPIRCRYCLNTAHCVKDCPLRPGLRRPRPPGRPAQRKQDGLLPREGNATNPRIEENTSAQPQPQSDWTEIPTKSRQRVPSPSLDNLRPSENRSSPIQERVPARPLLSSNPLQPLPSTLGS
jgi:hypothetical protein